MRLHARAIGIAGALAHLGQPGVGFGAVAVGGHRRLIKPLGLQQQSPVQKAPGLGRELLRPLQWRERSQPRGVHLVQHLRCLAEGRGVKAAHNALQRIGRWVGIGAGTWLSQWLARPAWLPGCFHAACIASASASPGRSLRHWASSFRAPGACPCRFRLTARLKW